MFGSPVKAFNPQGADLHVEGEEGEVHLAARVPVQKGLEGNQGVLMEPEGGGIVQVDRVSDLRSLGNEDIRHPDLVSINSRKNKILSMDIFLAPISDEH
jgi:hypothetical protein